MESIDVNSPTDSGSNDDLLRQIDAVLESIEKLSHSDVNESDFFSQLLEQASLPIETLCATVWQIGPNEQLVLTSQRGEYPLFSTNDQWQAERRRLSSSNETQVGRFTVGEKKVLSFSSRFAGSSSGIVAFYVSDDLPETALTGYLEYTQAIADLAEQFSHHSDRRELRTLLSHWKKYETTSLAIQKAWGQKAIAFQVANEGRYFLGVDRLSIATKQNKKFRLSAVSGVDSVKTTADLPKRLERLIDAVTKIDETFVFRAGQIDPPPQIERALNEYQELAAANTIVIVPVKSPFSTSTPIAALVAEQFKSPPSRNLLPRMDALSKQVGIAIGRDDALNKIPFFRFGTFLRPFGRLFERTHWPKWISAALGVTAMVLCLCLVKTDFEIRVDGQLRPQVEHFIYASETGIVTRIHVKQDEKVLEQDPLIELESSELELERARITGELATARQELVALDARRLQVKTGDRELQQQETQLSGESQAVKKRIENLNDQLRLVEKQQLALTITSPIAGQVLTWDPVNSLSNRPVQKGQRLLQVANLQGPWVLRFQVPDHRVGHILQAANSSEQPLALRFQLANNPQSELSGRIRRIDDSSQIDENMQSTVLVEAEFYHQEVPDLRPGMSVSGKVDCGRCSLGYLWFHEFFEEIQRRFF